MDAAIADIYGGKDQWVDNLPQLSFLEYVPQDGAERFAGVPTA